MPAAKPATVEGYVAALPPEAAFVFERLRETIRAAAPGATEAIRYDMPVFRIGDAYIFYVGAWKAHIGIYPIHLQAPDLEADIAPFRSGKDTLKFRYRDPIPHDLVTRLVRARLKTLQAASAP